MLAGAQPLGEAGGIVTGRDDELREMNERDKLDGAQILAATADWYGRFLRVTDPDRSVGYYHDLLGLDLIQRFGADARFVSRDGYHHHFGLNRWGGISSPQPARALGLVDATVAAASISAPTVARDPDGLTLNLVPLA